MKKKNAEPLVDPVLIDDQDLPEGWTKKTLLEVAGGEPRLVVGGPFGSCLKVDDYQKTGIPIIRLQNVGHAKFIDKDIKYLTLEKAKELEYHTFVKGDLVLAKLGDPIGKTCIIPDKFEWGIVVSDVVRIRLENDQIDKKYLLYYLNSSHSISQINSQVFGSTRPRVNLKEVRDIVILVPPLAEQLRIVARVEALLTHINAARYRISRVPLIMKKFRQAVLAVACSGRLTEGWREENPDKLSTIDVIDFINANKQKNSDPSEYTGDYPESWIPIKIGDLFDNWGGATPSTSESSYWGGDIPWVSSKDIKSLRIIQGSDFITKKALEGSRLRLSPIGSVIIVVRSGILAHTFPVAIADAEVVINQDIKAFYTPNQSLNEWLALFFRGQSQYILENIRKDGTTVQSIRFDDLKKMVLYIPSFDEQHEIVLRVNALFERADAFDQEVVAASRRCERLTQAVLGKAFAGKL